jgi:hypothetical protein
MKARAKKQLKEKDSSVAGGVQAENDSRFVLTKRNDSLALDAKEVNLGKKKKGNVQINDRNNSYHDGIMENEGLIIRDRI